MTPNELQVSQVVPQTCLLGNGGKDTDNKQHTLIHKGKKGNTHIHHIGKVCVILKVRPVNSSSIKEDPQPHKGPFYKPPVVPLGWIIESNTSLLNFVLSA